MKKGKTTSSNTGRTSLVQIEEKLKKDKIAIETELAKIAVPDKEALGGWKSIFPYGNGESGTAALERQADEVEEYAIRLPLEHSLETRLAAVNAALARIAAGSYGKCGKCGGNIPLERLNVSPEAGLCVDCQE